MKNWRVRLSALLASVAMLLTVSGGSATAQSWDEGFWWNGLWCVEVDFNLLWCEDGNFYQQVDFVGADFIGDEFVEDEDLFFDRHHDPFLFDHHGVHADDFPFDDDDDDDDDDHHGFHADDFPFDDDDDDDDD